MDVELKKTLLFLCIDIDFQIKCITKLIKEGQSQDSIKLNIKELKNTIKQIEKYNQYNK